MIPAAEHGTSLRAYVGGVTAVNDDFATVITHKLLLFIGVILGLGFLLLLLAFRSVLIPAAAAVMNLLAAAASFGVTVAIFQFGWGLRLLNLGQGGPVESFLPVLMLAVLFGLSMDYEVFLVSRISEEWVASGDNRLAVRTGQATTGRVIIAAATIMICVFSAFILSGQQVIGEFGLGLAAAVLLDAFLLRTILVPALMHLAGRANWWLPGWLDRLLPQLSIEPAHGSSSPSAPADAASGEVHARDVAGQREGPQPGHDHRAEGVPVVEEATPLNAAPRMASAPSAEVTVATRLSCADSHLIRDMDPWVQQRPVPIHPPECRRNCGTPPTDHRLQLPRDPAAAGGEPLAQLRGVRPGGEQQDHGHRVGGPEDDLQGRVSLDDQFQPAFSGDLIHRPGWTRPHLFLADRLHEPFTVELAQLRVQGSAGDPAPHLGVGQLRGPAYLVAVHGPAPGQQAEDRQAAQVHRLLVCTY